jgi:RNA polymerase sigma-54 factor
MKPSLQLKLTQHLALTPQLQQSIRLLQLSTIELEHELEKYLLDNPLLEREEEYRCACSGATTGAMMPPAGAGGGARLARRAHPYPMTKAGWTTNRILWHLRVPSTTKMARRLSGHPGGTVSLREHLLWQLGLMTLPDRDRVLVRCLVEALDDDGYLTQSLENWLK